MGSLPREALSDLPFRYYEYLTGVYDSLARRWYRLPLLGYEADSKGAELIAGARPGNSV